MLTDSGSTFTDEDFRLFRRPYTPHIGSYLYPVLIPNGSQRSWGSGVRSGKGRAQ